MPDKGKGAYKSFNTISVILSDGCISYKPISTQSYMLNMLEVESNGEYRELTSSGEKMSFLAKQKSVPDVIITAAQYTNIKQKT